MSGAERAGRITILIALFFSVALIQGWVVSVAWWLFVVPYFAVPPLTVFHGAGVSILARSAVHGVPDEESELTLTQLGYRVLFALISAVLLVLGSYGIDFIVKRGL